MNGEDDEMDQYRVEGMLSEATPPPSDEYTPVSQTSVSLDVENVDIMYCWDDMDGVDDESEEDMGTEAEAGVKQAEVDKTSEWAVAEAEAGAGAGAVAVVESEAEAVVESEAEAVAEAEAEAGAVAVAESEAVAGAGAWAEVDAVAVAVAVAEAEAEPESEKGQAEVEIEEVDPAPLEHPPRRTRGRPRGVHNKPKKKLTPPPRAKRVGQKRVRADLSLSPTRNEYDMESAIIVQVSSPVMNSPSKKARNTIPSRHPRSNDKSENGVGTRHQSRHILKNFGVDLQSLYDHLNDSQFGPAQDEHYELWLGRVKEALETPGTDKGTLLQTHKDKIIKVSRKVKTRPSEDSLMKAFVAITPTSVRGENGACLKIQVGDSVFVKPPREVYIHTTQYKKKREISGDMYWQGKIIHLGKRKDELDSDDEGEDEKKAAVIVEWFYTYYDVKETKESLIKTLYVPIYYV
ncbi:hypothetical protein CVT25_011245 [Psilocybe cyanescens]|uniref:Uncharacterized protein n=1 Tax=Psilocybe cyanescens TaxID=93625 RepID=A0A409W4W7_PSICY|nr:hypothetical protein CVT25_011245 [Psilocybe cyanescens]